MNKKVLVTGATGYVGSRLTASLVENGYVVYALSKDPQIPVHPQAIPVVGDITAPITIPERLEAIYHCAGVIHDESEMYKVNVIGTQHIIALALQYDCPLIYLSSAGITGRTDVEIVDETTPCHPHNAYEISKHEGEKLVVQEARTKGLRAHILRPTTIFGPDMNPEKNSFLQLVASMRSGMYKNIGHGMYNIIHVDVVVRALELLGETVSGYGGVYIVNDPISYRKMGTIVKSIYPAIHTKTQTIPYFMAYGATILLSALSFLTGKRNPLTLARLSALTNSTIYSQEKMKNTLFFIPNKSTAEHIAEVYRKYITNETLS